MWNSACASINRGPAHANLKRVLAACPLRVELRCGAVALGRTYPLPPLSSGGALVVPPSLRFHIPLIGRVEDWRAGLGRSLGSLLSRPFVCECPTISTMPRLQLPPRRTQRADFPHCAPPFASRQRLWDLSCWGDFRPVASHSIGVKPPRPVSAFFKPRIRSQRTCSIMSFWSSRKSEMACNNESRRRP
jgi:hypothetical protein